MTVLLTAHQERCDFPRFKDKGSSGEPTAD
jgi:hypothetical protein